MIARILLMFDLLSVFKILNLNIGIYIILKMLFTFSPFSFGEVVLLTLSRGNLWNSIINKQTKFGFIYWEVVLLKFSEIKLTCPIKYALPRSPKYIFLNEKWLLGRDQIFMVLIILSTSNYRIFLWACKEIRKLNCYLFSYTSIVLYYTSIVSFDILLAVS